MTTTASARRLRVMFSFEDPANHPDHVNPFTTELIRSIRPLAAVRFFSWRPALFGRFDVLHVQWPELLVLANSPLVSLAKSLLLIGLLATLRLRRIPIVMTVHNRNPHDQHGRVSSAAMKALERAVTYRIFMNPDGSEAYPGAASIIPHGHYRTHFGFEGPLEPTGDASTFRLLLFGTLRPYKNIESLIRSFQPQTDDDLRLTIIGKARSASYLKSIEDAANGDPRINIFNRFATESELIEEIQESNLVVLPYPDLYNSGALFLALSVGRPVLIRRSGEAERLAAEFGPEWVILFDDELNEAALRSVVTALSDSWPQEWPNMSARDWPAIADAHLDAYRDAIAIAHARR